MRGCSFTDFSITKHIMINSVYKLPIISLITLLYFAFIYKDKVLPYSTWYTITHGIPSLSGQAKNSALSLNFFNIFGSPF